MAGWPDDHRSLALGEFRGLLAAFEWANTKSDHGCTFDIQELPSASDVQQALTLDFGEYATKVTIVLIDDWRAHIGQAFERWFFEYTDQLKPGVTCLLGDPDAQHAIVQVALDKLAAALQPLAAWSVCIEPNGFYECEWDDFAIESSSGRFLLHLGVSD